MSERSAAMKRYREWQSGHWSGDKPEWDEVHGATEDAWLAAEQAQSDLAAEREQKANDLILKLAMALWSHDPKHPLVQRAKDWLPSCEADTALATHEHNEGES